MTKTTLIATVAALAITAPVAAQGPGGHGHGNGGAQAPAQQQQRAERPQRQAPQQRAERAPRQQQQAQRMERAPRQQQQAQRMERAPQQQRAERAPRQMQMHALRAERQAQAPRMMQRQQRAERHVAVPQRQQRAERVAPQRQQRAERHVAAPQRQRRAERMAPQRQQRVERANMRQQAATFDRRQQRIANRDARQFQPAQQQALRQQQAFRQQSFDRQQAYNAPVARDSGWARLLDRAGIANREGVRVARQADRRPLVMVGQPLDTGYYRDSYVPLGYRATYYDTPDYYYRYDDDYGYLYRVARYDNVVQTLIPLYGGAFSIGQPIPVAYRSYNVPSAYQSYYYDTPDAYYRYGGGAIYQVDPATQLISAVVALLSGQNLGIGQPLPASYGVYNVPTQYRSRYYDTADNWYRYDDGMIYGVDPRTRLIESAYPVASDPYYIGQPMPAAWQTYNVPNAYRDVYYDTPDYDYRYASGGIYQVDPRTQLVQALVALVGGQNYAVGQALPASYGVYNVPYQYRSQYYDNDQYNYRYNDGYVYRIDPRTRVINGMYDVVVA